MELPHLQIICGRLYRDCRKARQRLRCRLPGIGEARGILGRYLQDVLEQLPGNGAQLARQVLKALVSSESTCWVRSKRDLAAAVQAEAAFLAEILDAPVRDRVLQREEVDGEVRYQLAHEYLIQEVGKWLDREDLAVKQAQELLQGTASWKQNRELLIPRWPYARLTWNARRCAH